MKVLYTRLFYHGLSESRNFRPHTQLLPRCCVTKFMKEIKPTTSLHIQLQGEEEEHKNKIHVRFHVTLTLNDECTTP
jgi:hypothetical protein